MVQEVEHMYDMAILRLPAAIREMNWLEFFGTERGWGWGCWAQGPLPPQIVNGCKGGAGIYPACNPRGMTPLLLFSGLCWVFYPYGDSPAVLYECP